MFSYAAKMAGIEPALFCENNEFCQKLLRVRYPGIYIHPDIKTLTKEIIDREINETDRVILSGGFPCQPHSIAGERKGSKDERNLFPEMLRVIRECKPEWVLGENVYGILNTDDGAFFEQEVITPLEDEGYSVQPYIIPASAIGAVHRRDRLWIIAQNTERIRCDSSIGKEKTNKRGFGKFSSGNDTGIISSHTRHRNDKRKKDKKEFTDEIRDGKTSELERSTRCDELRTTTNTESDRRNSQTQQKDGDKEIYRKGGRGFVNSGNDASDSKRKGLEGTISERGSLTGRCNTKHFNANWIEVATQLCGVDAAPSTGIHRPRYRKQRLEGLGNGIQWEIAYIFFKLIKQREQL